MECLCKPKASNQLLHDAGIFVQCDFLTMEYVPRLPRLSSQVVLGPHLIIKSLQDRAFSSLQTLRSLSIKATAINNWHPGAVSFLPHQSQLSVRADNVTPANLRDRTYFQGLTSLSSLYLSMGLQAVPLALCNLLNLTTLILSDNSIKHLSFPPCFSNLTKLRILDLSNNPVEVLNPKIFHRLYSLDLSFISLSHMDLVDHVHQDTFKYFKDLKALYLTCSHIKKHKFYFNTC